MNGNASISVLRTGHSFDDPLDDYFPSNGNNWTSRMIEGARVMWKIFANHSSSALSGIENEDAMKADIEWSEALEYKAKTPLGKRLMEIRKRIIASGVPLLDFEDIEREIAEARGEIE